MFTNTSEQFLLAFYASPFQSTPVSKLNLTNVSVAMATTHRESLVPFQNILFSGNAAEDVEHTSSIQHCIAGDMSVLK